MLPRAGAALAPSASRNWNEKKLLGAWPTMGVVGGVANIMMNRLLLASEPRAIKPALDHWSAPTNRCTRALMSKLPLTCRDVKWNPSAPFQMSQPLADTSMEPGAHEKL